jgi:hypothetical protein
MRSARASCIAALAFDEKPAEALAGQFEGPAPTFSPHSRIIEQFVNRAIAFGKFSW